MKMKDLCLLSLLSATLFAPMAMAAPVGDDLLTGDQKLACEAILCLSSGERPHECAASLRRYFSIKLKKPHKTIKARKNFLKLCPSSNENGMPELTDALANGAGRCDAAELNRVMRTTYRVKVCPKRIRIRNREDSLDGGGDGCHWETRSYIRNVKPSYCQAYFNHEWTTAGQTIKYIGTEKQGGHWVEVPAPTQTPIIPKMSPKLKN